LTTAFEKPDAAETDEFSRWRDGDKSICFWLNVRRLKLPAHIVQARASALIYLGSAVENVNHGG
jgi:hypothetical protein